MYMTQELTSTVFQVKSTTNLSICAYSLTVVKDTNTPLKELVPTLTKLVLIFLWILLLMKPTETVHVLKNNTGI